VTNFYAAAREGLAAELIWPGEGKITAERLLTERLLPAARSALPRFGLDRSQNRRLDVVEARARSGRTGRGVAARGLRGAWRKRPSAHGRLLRKTTRRRAGA